MTQFKVNLETVTLMIVASLFVDVIIPTSAEGISCYKCYASHPDNEENDLLCSQFDASPRFQVHCPDSTLCRKKTIHYRLKTSVITAVIRDCAPQKRTDIAYSTVDNTWHSENVVVKTAYEEDCSAGIDRGAGPSELCFCGYNLCNSTPSINDKNVYHIFLSMVMMLLLKLL